MRCCLPVDAKISKGAARSGRRADRPDAKNLVQECVSEASQVARPSDLQFISFIASEAAEATNGERRKLMTGEDILAAFDRMGLETYGEVRSVRRRADLSDAQDLPLKV